MCFTNGKANGIVAAMSATHDAIRDAMARSSKTRYRLWQETGISQAQLCEFFHGRRGMSLDNLELLAEALGLEIIVRRARRKKGR